MSVRYLPASIFTVKEALCTSKGLEPQEVQIGCGEVKDMYLGLKKVSESRPVASSLSFCSQWSITKDLIFRLKEDLVGGS